jgi:hypothetical protein
VDGSKISERYACRGTQEDGIERGLKIFKREAFGGHLRLEKYGPPIPAMCEPTRREKAPK